MECGPSLLTSPFRAALPPLPVVRLSIVKRSWIFRPPWIEMSFCAVFIREYENTLPLQTLFFSSFFSFLRLAGVIPGFFSSVYGNESCAVFKRRHPSFINKPFIFSSSFFFFFFLCGTQEDAAARVRARPLPAPSNGFCPQPSDRPLTETSEFCLSSQARHEKAAQEFQDRVRKEEERARRATEVRVRPEDPALPVVFLFFSWGI